MNGFTNRCFCWTLRSIRIFWIQNHFCAITGAWDIRKTKRVFLINENVIDYWNLLSNAEVYRKIDNINFNWKLCVHFRQLKASQGLERPVRVSHEPVKAVRGHYRTVRDNPNYYEYEFIWFRNPFCLTNFSAPWNRTEMVLYSLFAYGSQCSAETNSLLFRCLVPEILGKM